jgi:hypothetical protein
MVAAVPTPLPPPTPRAPTAPGPSPRQPVARATALLAEHDIRESIQRFEMVSVPAVSPHSGLRPAHLKAWAGAAATGPQRRHIVLGADTACLLNDASSARPRRGGAGGIISAACTGTMC